MLVNRLRETMTDRLDSFAAIMVQLADLAETAPSASAHLRIIDLIGRVHDARAAEEAEQAYKDMTN